jgi:hypothetical protein
MVSIAFYIIKLPSNFNRLAPVIVLIIWHLQITLSQVMNQTAFCIFTLVITPGI